MAQQADNDWKIDWNIDTEDKDYIATKELYAKQCPGLMHTEPQTAMFKVLTAGQKIGRPLLLFLCDSYNRYRIQQFKKQQLLQLQNKNARVKILSIQQWIKTDPTIQKITNSNPKRERLLKSAMDTFYSRFNSPIRFGSIERINDCIRPFALYVEEVLYLIQQLLLQKIGDAGPPFQIDIWIIPKAIANKEEKEDESEDDEADDESKTSDEYDIDKSLDTHKLPYVTHCRKESDRTRVFYDNLYAKFKQVDGMKDEKDYPRNKRFCIIADRRTHDQEDMRSQVGDTLYMYQTAKGKDVPNDHLYEKYIQNSAECVLPSSDHCDEVTAKTGSSKYFMLSFHVDAEDEIRCYLYHKSQFVRFYPHDILDVWPCFFVQSANNEQFVKDQRNENADGIAVIDLFKRDIEITDRVFKTSPFHNK
eukprot:106223_1